MKIPEQLNNEVEKNNTGRDDEEKKNQKYQKSQNKTSADDGGKEAVEQRVAARDGDEAKSVCKAEAPAEAAAAETTETGEHGTDIVDTKATCNVGEQKVQVCSSDPIPVGNKTNNKTGNATGINVDDVAAAENTDPNELVKSIDADKLNKTTNKSEQKVYVGNADDKKMMLVEKRLFSQVRQQY